MELRPTLSDTLTESRTDVRTDTRVYLPTPTQLGSGSIAARAWPLPPMPAVAGNAFAILTNGWEAMVPLAEHVSNRLKAAGASEVYVIGRDRTGSGANRPENDVFLDALAGKVAGALAGLGN